MSRASGGSGASPAVLVESAADAMPPGHPALGGSFLALLAGAVAIGFAPIFVRLSEVGPVSTAFWRLALALPLLWMADAAGGRRTTVAGERAMPPSLDRAAVWGMIVAGLFFAGDLAVWHWSIHFTSVLNSTMLANFAPVFVVLYAWVALRERITRRFLLAMTVALGGLILLLGRDFRLDPRAMFGDALGLVTAAFYAGYLVSIKSLRGRFATVSIMARSGLATGLALLPLALVSRERFTPSDMRGWLVLLGLAVVSHVGGQSLIAYALAKLPASVASVSLLVQPVTAALAAAVLLHEAVAPVQIAGMALVLAGVFVARLESR